MGLWGFYGDFWIGVIFSRNALNMGYMYVSVDVSISQNNQIFNSFHPTIVTCIYKISLKWDRWANSDFEMTDSWGARANFWFCRYGDSVGFPQLCSVGIRWVQGLKYNPHGSLNRSTDFITDLRNSRANRRRRSRLPIPSSRSVYPTAACQAQRPRTILNRNNSRRCSTWYCLLHSVAYLKPVVPYISFLTDTVCDNNIAKRQVFLQWWGFS